eukprot:2606174-Karenia_brevis.AAC.1
MMPLMMMKPDDDDDADDVDVRKRQTLRGMFRVWSVYGLVLNHHGANPTLQMWRHSNIGEARAKNTDHLRVE